MDRERIERRDFPTGRRGYDPAAVDEHLRRVADEFETHVHAPRASLADSTSEQVRLILEAAERGASELRSQAGEEASDHVARVAGRRRAGCSPSSTRSRSELNRLLGRAARERRAARAGARGAAGRGLGGPPRRPSSPPLRRAVVAARPPPPAATLAARRRARRALAAANGAPAALPDLGPFEEDFAAAEPADAGARLIALNMALSGSPREETARYLAEHFELDDAEALLDDVYARAGR